MSPEGDLAPGAAPRIALGLTDRCKENGPETGTCWVCTPTGVLVIRMGPVQLPAHTAPLYGCRPCTQRLHTWATTHERTTRSP